MLLSVTKEVTFAAAHFLPGYDGPCANLHGHEWKLQVEFMGEVNKTTGMVIDFVKIKKLLQEVVIEKFDHSYINEEMYLPTAENMIIKIVTDILDYLVNRPELAVVLERVRLYETPTSFSEWRREHA